MFNYKCVKCGGIWRSTKNECPHCMNSTPDNFVEVECCICGITKWDNTGDLQCGCGGSFTFTQP